MKKKRGRGAIIAVFLVTLVIFGGFWGTWSTITTLLAPPVVTGTNKVTLTILANESTQQIADELQAKGLIRNALIFRLWARLKGLDTTIQAGVYNLTPGMNVDTIIAKLQDGKPDQKPLLVIDGWRLEQIANQADSLGLTGFSKQDFLNYTHHPDQFPDKAKYPLLDKLTSMEGLIFPDTYQIPVGYDTVKILDMMLDEMTQVVKDNNLVTMAQQHKMTVYQLITLASIVQREASNAKQMPLIAGIYWKRIYQPSADVGGPVLQSDPTVEYAYDTDHPPTGQAEYWVDLNQYGQGSTVETNSPWNTYNHPGWPPTPISSPNLKALQAAANPQQTNCYYFFTMHDATGTLKCEPTYKQIQADEAKYLH